MNDVNLLERLREIDFFQGISGEHLEKIASIAQLVEFSEGTVIFREGDLATTIYLITGGNVSLEICAPGIGCRRIQTVGKGELLGWSPVLEQPRLSATARTLSYTQAIKISGNQILTLCEHNPRLGYEFMRRVTSVLAKRLVAVRTQLLDVFGAESLAAETSLH